MTTPAILACDPGPTESAFVLLYENGKISPVGIMENESAMQVFPPDAPPITLAIEGIQSYGMAVGAEVFSTAIWIGRFVQRWQDRECGPFKIVYRKDVKLHLCGSHRAKDPNIRQALIDRFGNGGGRKAAMGTKRQPGPLFGISSHLWSALAVGVTARDDLATPSYYPRVCG